MSEYVDFALQAAMAQQEAACRGPGFDIYGGLLGSLGGGLGFERAQRQPSLQERLYGIGMSPADMQHYLTPTFDPYKDETDEQRADRKLREVKEALEREWVAMPPSVLPIGWKPLSRWEMFKLDIGLWLINLSTIEEQP